MQWEELNQEWRKPVYHTEKRKYCTTIIADENKPVTSFSYHLKEAWIDSCALWFCILSKLGGNSLVTYFMKINISA